MGCVERGDGDNNNNRRGSSEVVDEDEVPYTGPRIPTRVVCSTDIYPVSRQQMIANRRKLKELGLLEHKPRMTKDGPIDGYTTTLTYGGPVRTKFFNFRAYQAARKRRFSEPVANKILFPLEAPYSQPTATTAKGKGRSVLKRHCVDLGETSDILADNLNSASDPSPTAGTEAEEKGGSVPNKDVGESSDIVVEITAIAQWFPGSPSMRQVSSSSPAEGAGFTLINVVPLGG